MLRNLFPDLLYITGGYLVVVMMTIFLSGQFYTWFFGIAGICLILLSTVLTERVMNSPEIWTEILSRFVLLSITIVVVLYIKRLNSSIEQEQQQVRAMFEQATEGIILADKKGNIVLINPAALTLFHYTKEELLKAPIEALIPARFHENHKEYREGFHKAPSNRAMGKGRELYAQTKEGDEFPVEVSLSYYKYRNEFYVIAFIVDITQRKEAERKSFEQKEQLKRVSDTVLKLNAELENKVAQRTNVLKEALAELEQSKLHLSEALSKEKELNEIKSRLVSMASHEFRTPLSTVMSSAALIVKYEKEEDQGKRQRHVQKIRDSVKHLNDLLGDFLSLGKLEEGKVDAAPEQIVIREFLHEIVEEMAGVCKAGQQIMISNEGCESFLTDKKLLRNILINLLSNASKFSAQGSSIFLNGWDEEDRLIVQVKDEGIGIPAQDLAHLFSSFYRASNVAAIEGTGLGLHIVKRYTDLLNGEISVKSELEKGTVVTLEIPELNKGS